MSNPYAAAADFGMKAIMGISAGVIEEANVNAQNIVNEANAYANNLVRGANNKLKAARGSLARYNQSINNQRTLENMGSEAEAAAINYRRARDSATNDNFEQQIAFAEQAGAQAAAGALSGITGGVADLVAGTTALRIARLQERADTAMKQGDWDAQQRQKHILQSGWDSLDTSEISDDLDYSVDVAVKRVRGGSLFSDILSGQSGKTLSDMGGFFSGSGGYDAFADRAGPDGSGSGGRQRTITGGR